MKQQIMKQQIMKSPVYLEITNGNTVYYSDREMTKFHRTDGPAIEYSNGTKGWYLNDKRHRTDGPAIEWPGGGKEWYLDGKLHRTDGPAVETSSGHKGWYVNGKRHRTDGPAFEGSGGTKSWYLDGKLMTEKEFVAATAPTIELTLDEIAAKFGVPAGNLKIKK